MEIKDVTAIAGVVVALGLGVYNVMRTRKVARQLDWLFLNNKRFELLRTSIETETLHFRVRTSLERLRVKLVAKRSTLSPIGMGEVQKQIDKTEKYITDLGDDIAFDRQSVTYAHELTCPTVATPELIQKINEILNTTKERYYQARRWQAQMDGHIAGAKDLLSVAETLTKETGNAGTPPIQR